MYSIAQKKMSLNQFSPDFADTLWWSSRPISTNNKRLLIPQTDRREQQRDDYCTDRESMFEKHLTPSDVGKLNRLVIPKQHAEKYFPLNNTNNNNSSNSNSASISHGSVNGIGVDKGLLLSFDDEAGKCWRFRYSYWNSSQSYVLTKGWSRYIKEKRLDAGDVVFFERDRVESDKFYIGWRRRSATVVTAGASTQDSGTGLGTDSIRIGIGGSRGVAVYSGHQPYPAHPFPYQPDCRHAGLAVQAKVTTPIINSKRLRLFGVNLECQVEEEASEEPPTPDGSSTSSQGQQVHQHHHDNFYYPASTQMVLSRMDSSVGHRCEFWN